MSVVPTPSSHPFLDALTKAFSPIIQQLLSQLGPALVSQFMPLLLQILTKGLVSPVNPVAAIQQAHAESGGDPAKFGEKLEAIASA